MNSWSRHPIVQHTRHSLHCFSQRADCGGTFTCAGCKRLVGWCLGCGDDLGAEHCDDCYDDRYTALTYVSRGDDARASLKTYTALCSYRDADAAAQELVADSFLTFRGGRYRLTDRAREALS